MTLSPSNVTSFIYGSKNIRTWHRNGITAQRNTLLYHRIVGGSWEINYELDRLKQT